MEKGEFKNELMCVCPPRRSLSLGSRKWNNMSLNKNGKRAIKTFLPVDKIQQAYYTNY
jgi:hypothetical protein